MKILTLIIIITSLVTISIVGCNNKETDRQSCKINVQIIDEVSFYDIYDSVEVIPLETTKESILMYRQTMPEKMIVENQKFYILDNNRIVIFDHNGKYLNKIDKLGRGRGEYLDVSDFNINKYTGNIEILSSTGFINIYNSYSMKFEKRINLRSKFKAFHAFQYLTSDIYVIWSKSHDGNQIELYSISKEKVVREISYNAPLWLPQAGLSNPHTPFYRYNDSLQFAQSYNGKVFNISQQPPYMSTRYGWDFGNATINIDNIPPDRDYKFYNNYFRSKNNFATLFVRYLESPYLFITCFKYNSVWYQMIYNKETKQHLKFHKYKEGIVGLPLTSDDKYAYSSSIYRYATKQLINEGLLDKETLATWKSLNENHNPAIIKYRYKQ